MNFRCFWWGHDPYVKVKGWHDSPTWGRSFCVSIWCKRCQEQVHFQYGSKEISSHEAIKNFYIDKEIM